MAHGNKGGLLLAVIAAAVIAGLIAGMMWIESYSEGEGQGTVQPHDAADR